VSSALQDQQGRQWAGISAAVEAAVRELPSRLMHVDPRLAVGAPHAPGGVEGSGLLLEGNWAAPARAREATGRACVQAGLHPAVAAAASVVSLRVVSSAVVAEAESITVRVSASGEVVCVSLRARFLAPRGLDGRGGAAVVRARPWGLGGSARRGGTGRGAHGGAWLFGVAVDAYGILLDRADVIVWFQMRLVAP
jgi:hypothetical protein